MGVPLYDIQRVVEGETDAPIITDETFIPSIHKIITAETNKLRAQGIYVIT